MTPRHFFNGFLVVALLAALLLMGRVLIAPDAGAGMFAKARQLEEAGQITLALRHYALLAERHPESPLAPRALLRQGDLLSARGRQNGDQNSLRAAMNAYGTLAQKYPSDALADDALFAAGQLAAEDLHDGADARRFYKLILERNSDRSDAAALATTKLGRLALAEGDAKTAQTLLQSIYINWPRNAQAGAEAQFHLGVLYETLVKNRKWAKGAYDATIARYPNSNWAASARERLGLLMFSDQSGRRPVQRVMIDIAPLPDDNGLPGAKSGQSLWDSLGILLAARGLNTDNTITRGWSLLPFWMGVDRANPGRVVAPEFDAFDNVVANAGLRFTIQKGGNAEAALRDLQSNLDAAREPLLYVEDGGEGRWTLCVGYDSERGEVYLQDRGARFNTLAVKSFAVMWGAKSKFGQPYTSLSFVASGEKPRSLEALRASLTPAAPTAPVNAPLTPPKPELNATPQFIWELPRLNQADAHTRTLRRAAMLLDRTGSDKIALNIAGLDFLARELTRIANSPDPNAPVDAPANAPTLESPIRQDALAPDGIAPTPTLAPPAPAAPRDFAPRARRVLQFFGAPAQNWVQARRRAAAFCEVAGRQSNRNLTDAVIGFTTSADALETARAMVPPIGAVITPMDRVALRELARQLYIARDAERTAARVLR